MKYFRESLIITLGFGALSTQVAAQAKPHASQKPNIVFILADDLGWMDVSYNGSKFYETPNIDALSKRGMIFTRAYAAAPVCSPSRGSILSGKYPAHTGYTGLQGQYGKPSKGKLIDAPSLPGLPLKEITLAEALKPYGYKTWHLGKWDLGAGDEYSPLKQGFDVSLTGFEEGEWKEQRFRKSDNKFITDELTDKAIELIEENKGSPFFLNLWYWAVHTPVRAKTEDINYFKDKAHRMGLDTIKPFNTGGFYPSAPWFDKDMEQKRIIRRTIQSDPVYAAFIYCLDQNVGRIMRKVDDLGLAGNTIFVFFSDNGGLSSTEGSPTCNYPLREGKGWMYDGGYREPCIVSWNGKINHGQVCNIPITGIDFYPTLLELAGIGLDTAQHIDGVNFAPLLLNKKGYKQRPLYWHSPHYFNNGSYPFSAVVVGDWKYIYNYEFENAELYKITNDISEGHNVIKDNPEIANDLKVRLGKWLMDVKAKYPSKNPDYGK